MILGDMISINTRRCLLRLTESELQHLLASDRDVWARAVKRGKAFQRAEQREKQLEQKRIEDSK